MPSFKAFIVVAFAFAASPVLADEDGKNCQMGGVAYSVGAGLAQGNDQILTCDASGHWMASPDGVASGCIHNGSHYGIGAFVVVALDGSLSMTCRADGIWRRYEAN